MYGAARQCVDYFNLKSLDELPSLAGIRDLDTINAELELVQMGMDPNGQLDVEEVSDSEEENEEGTAVAPVEMEAMESESQAADSEQEPAAESAQAASDDAADAESDRAEQEQETKLD